MAFTLTAKIHEIGEINQVSERFKKREFVVITEQMAGPSVYTEYIKFQSIQDHVVKLDEFKVGDMVEVSFDLKGRRWEDPKNGEIKYFTNLQAWRIDKASPAAETAAAPPPAQTTTPPDFPTAPPGSEPAGQAEIDDLPF